MKTIELSRNQVTIVDDEDFDILNQYKWFCSNSGYAMRAPWPTQKPKHLIMHRIILNCPKGLQVDHINGNKLDNRKSNLRIVEEKYNHLNIAKRCTNKSGHKGVDWRPEKQKWRARINLHKKAYSLGHYDNIVDAIEAYNKAAKILYGKYERIEK